MPLSREKEAGREELRKHEKNIVMGFKMRSDLTFISGPRNLAVTRVRSRRVTARCPGIKSNPRSSWKK